MQYFIGLLTGVVFFIVFFVGIYVGTRLNKRPRPPDVDESRQREMKQLNDDFKKVFSYDVATAVARKKV